MIKGLQPRLAEAGKIKIGGLGSERTSKRGGTYRLPEKHDYFTITTTRREGNDPRGDLIPDLEMMRALDAACFADSDGKIRRLPVVVHSDEIDEVFPTAYVAYTGKRMFCRGDGEVATRREIKGGEWTGAEKQVECPCPYLQADERGERRCKPNGTLHCSIALPDRAVAGAVHRWRTTSIISIQQMMGSLKQVRDQVVGTLRGVPLQLIVHGVQVNPVGAPSSTVYVCHMQLRSTDLSAVQRDAIAAAQARQQLAALFGRDPAETQYRAMLSAPGQDDDDDPDVAKEYYPDEVVGSTPAGAEVIAPAPAPMPNPLASLLPGPAAEPPSKPATPDPEPEKRRTRRTRCNNCGELFGPGIVVDGLCEGCRVGGPPADDDPAPEHEPDKAPEIGPGPELTAYQRIQAAYKAAVARGVEGTAVTGAMGGEFPDFAKRAPQDWSTADADKAEEIIGAL